jgi:CubicO group peptidase (beta-lactamase class C family)
MKRLTLEERLELVYRKYEKKMKSEGMAFLIEDDDNEIRWQRETGALRDNHKFATASVTKLYTTTVIMNLVDEGKIKLESKICEYLPEEIIEGLHDYKGIDYSRQLTIRQLIAQTSGLPDYYTEKSNGALPIDQQFALDPFLPFEKALAISKQLSPRFIPDRKGKAYYSDMNFDLLGKIIEYVTGLNVAENFIKYIYEPLHLHETYMFEKNMEFDLPGIWVKGNIYKVPNLLSGWPASGSVISTKTDMMIFLKAFWNGTLFDKMHLEEMKVYNYIQFYPIQYGVGHMRFKAFGSTEIIGHSGSTGVLCYYAPEYRVYLTGCMNEVNESKATRMVLQLANCFKYEKGRR